MVSNIIDKEIPNDKGNLIIKEIKEEYKRNNYKRGFQSDIIGLEGENNVAMKLSNLFSFRNVSIGIDGFSEGVEGYPDISLNKNGNLFYIEVKSIIPFTFSENKYHANSVKINRYSWIRLKERAKGKISTIIMIVELRINLGLNDYFIIDYNTIEDFILKSKAEWVHIPLWFVLLKCRKLEWIEGEFIPNPIETNQDKLEL